MQVETPNMLFERLDGGRLSEQPLRTGTVLRPRVPVASTPALLAETLSPRQVGEIEADWRELETRTLEPNAFHAADFLLAACQHVRDGAAPHLIAIWEPANLPAQRRLVGLFPFQKPRSDWSGSLLRGWTHPFVGFSAPLVDRVNTDAIIMAALDHLHRNFPEMTAICLGGLATHGPIAAAVARVTTAQGTLLSRLGHLQRATLAEGQLKSLARPAGAKKLRQLRRRLSEAGTLDFAVAATYSEVRAATEDFLVLEAKGWKGARGSALLQDPDTSNFVRTMVWSAARHDHVRIASLSLDGRIIASVIMLVAQDTGYLWKIAYDEDFARFSPGVLLIEQFSQQLLTDKTVALVDSCAGEGYAMIEGLWSGRRAICDLMIGLGRGQTPAFLASLARERFRRRLREKVKATYKTLRARF